MLFLITYYFKRTWVDFSHKTNAKGLVLPKFESWGTETAKYVNFISFPFIFTLFTSETHKTKSWDIFDILMHKRVFLFIFAVYNDKKWWVFEHSSIPHTKLLLVPSSIFGKLDGFQPLYQIAITSGVAECFSSSKSQGTPIPCDF